VYSAVSETVQPDEHLAGVEGLDVVLQADNLKSYTLRTPDRATREISQLAEREGVYAFRITSLKPLNPQNAPTEWERSALEIFERGEQKEANQLVLTDEGEYYRYIAPLYFNEHCLPCHADQGYQDGDVRGGISIQLPMSEARAAIRANNLQLLFTGVGIVALVLLMLWLLIERQISHPLGELRQAALAMRKGDFNYTTQVRSNDELGVLAASFNQVGAELSRLYGDLEREVSTATHDLAVRTRQFETAAKVGNVIASYHTLDELLTQVTHLISDQFDFYHVGVFLLDETAEFAELRAANSPGGQVMLANRHRLKVGAEGLVGFVTANRQPRIALDVGVDAVHFKNPQLPDTRSEVALPLISAGRMLGALDVQSTAAGAFTPDDVDVLRLVADQLANAIENTRLLEENQASLEFIQRAYLDAGQKAWEELLAARAEPAYAADDLGVVRPAGGEWDEEMRLAARLGQTVQSGDSLAIPIKIHDQVTGIVRLAKGGAETGWTQDEISLMETLGSQLSVALESARLYRETQRRAERERLAGQITAKIRASNDPKVILNTALRELRQALARQKERFPGASPEPQGNGGKSAKEG
jgi:GAF domain-containing protein/HAMP domain-containing protein